MKPTIGRIVHYTLSDDDAAKINRRRTTGAAIAERIASGDWPVGAQAHIGRDVSAGEVHAMLITHVPAPKVGEMTPVNGRVFLDGSDEFQASHVQQVVTGGSDGNGLWNWPPREA